MIERNVVAGAVFHRSGRGSSSARTRQDSGVRCAGGGVTGCYEGRVTSIAPEVEIAREWTGALMGF